jgi:hypothetical protein
MARVDYRHIEMFKVLVMKSLHQKIKGVTYFVSGTWAECYKTHCMVKLLCKIGFFTQKSKFLKFHCYENFNLK